ncbi:uncharacterized protein [Rutidosis leptorrhynchoides]|uniref:uncharacterized protein isoform X2 n=1 Tax=Rutidosis leptorrhynchoides TaxID=125765 RepID=UPI003A9996D4
MIRTILTCYPTQCLAASDWLYCSINIEIVFWYIISCKSVLREWTARAQLCDMLNEPVRISMVGKYTGLSDSYSADGVLVSGGFRDRCVEGKIIAAKYALEYSIPYLGICLWMQTVVIEGCNIHLIPFVHLRIVSAPLMRYIFQD